MTSPEPISDVQDFAERFADLPADADNAIGSLVSGRYAAYALVAGSLSTSEMPEPGPSQGNLTTNVATGLAAVLARHTETADRCYFAMWEGYAEFSRLPGERVTLPPERRMLVFAGDLAHVGTPIGVDHSWRLPVRWWTTDGQWQVGADVYSSSVLVGGSEACIDAVLASTKLRARRVQPTDLLRIDEL